MRHRQLVVGLGGDTGHSVETMFIMMILSPQVHVTVRCLPAWWRLAQCLRSFHDTGHYRNLANAGKYSTLFLGEICIVRRLELQIKAREDFAIATRRGLLQDCEIFANLRFNL